MYILFGFEPGTAMQLRYHNKSALKLYLVCTKDHIEKIDFQELIFAVVNWPNSELYGAFVCRTYKITGNCFPGCGVWVTVDFDSKYKFEGVKLVPMGVPIHEEEEKSSQQEST